MSETGNLHLINPGPLSLVQDLGRKATQHLGYSQCGAADEHAYLWSNRLLENPCDTASIEITFGPFHARFTHATQIALCGSNNPAFINDKPARLWQCHNVAAGDHIRLSPAAHGTRIYLSVKNGFLCDNFKGSASTSLREKVGYNNGRILDKQCLLPYKVSSNNSPHLQATPFTYIPDYRSELILKVIPGYQYSRFSEDQIRRFFTQEYTISKRVNRMGYRLEGNPIASSINHLYSEGIAYGAIQIPPDGQPIVLLKDRQTIGGYPKLGSVSQLDCFRLSQRQPNQVVRFALGDIQQLRRDLQLFYEFFRVHT